MSDKTRAASTESLDSVASESSESGNPPGVLRCGTLQKPHGPLGKWANRYYVLTEDCLHRFARANSDMFFGKEIAHYDLECIMNVKPKNQLIIFDLVVKGKRAKERKIKCPDMSSAEQWVVAIKRAKAQLEIRRRDSGGADGRMRSGSGDGGKRGGRKNGRRRQHSITGDYHQMSTNSPLRFGAGGVGVHKGHLPSPFCLKIQQSDGSTSSKGNSLVPDEELCVGGVLNSSVLVIEDTSGGSVRLPLSELANVEKIERKLMLTRDGEEEEEEGGVGGKGGRDGGDGEGGGATKSVDDELPHVSLRIRFAPSRERESRSLNDEEESSHGRIHVMTLGLSVLVVVASSVFLMQSSEELQGPVGIWATCMVVGTFILGLLAYFDGRKLRLKKFKEKEEKNKKRNKNGGAGGGAEVWRIMYVALLDDSGEIKEHNQKKIEDQAGKWSFERMMEVLGYKNPTERQELLDHIPLNVETPQRWLNCEKENPSLARKRWAYTTKFRKTFGFNDILNRPHPMYDVIKKNWDCSYYGKDKTGKHPVFYDKPAGVNMKRMRQLGITDDDLCYHYVWITEYAYKYLCDNSDDMASCITVYNLNGLDRSLFFGKKKALMMKTLKIMEQHYPERTYKIYILNGPWWFNGFAWPIVTAVAQPQTLEKIKNFGSKFGKFVADLATYVDLDKVPKEFGGQNPLPLKNSEVSEYFFFFFFFLPAQQLDPDQFFF